MQVIKLLGLSLAGLILSIVVLLIVLWIIDFILQKTEPLPQPEFGVTFSPVYAENLGLNSDDVFKEMLDELKVKKIRIPVYWNIVEPSKNQFNFQSYDKLLDIAKDNNVQVVLVVGYKVPRWPECFEPAWVQGMDQENHQTQIKLLLKKTVNHFKERKEIIAWQVENEPLFQFGYCQKLDTDFLKKEVDLVKTLDSRPIYLTDSGEMSPWVIPLQLGDKMGISLYRTTWHPIFGFFHYPLPALFYNLRAKITLKLFAPNFQGVSMPEGKSVFIVELQTEPWGPGVPLPQVKVSEQTKIFSLQQFKDNINFAKRSKLAPVYLWGVEWWYYIKLQGHPEYLEYAKEIFK